MTTKIRITVIAALAAVAAWATVTDDLVAQRAPRWADVVPGQWHADLEKARAYAEEKGLPLIAVWSNGDFCQHCLIWEGCATSPVFVEWMKKSGIVFYFGYVKDGYLNAAGDFGGGPSSDGKEGYHGTSFYWCCKNQNATLAWPYVRFYWPKGGVDLVYTGSATDGEFSVKGGLPCMVRDSVIEANPSMNAPWVFLGDYGTYNPGGRYLLDFITNESTGVFRNWKPVASEPPVYGEFAETVQSAKERPAACLQFEYGSSVTSVVVPLTRTSATENTGMATNMLVCNFPGRVTTNRVLWSKGQTVKNYTMTVDSAWYGAADTTVTNYVTMMLKTEKYTKAKTTYAAIVPPVANTPKNPRFIGERTKNKLAFGEWTMDLQVALAKARDTEGGRLLALVGGSLWCKDCAMADRHIFDTQVFRDWAAANHVALVAVDIPNVSASDPTGSKSSCLLNSVVYKTNDSYVKNTGKGEGERYQCGLAYQSRHGVKPTEAASALATNRDLAAGMFNKLVVTNPHRPGVPTLYALRPDRSIAGRIYQFSNSTASLDASSAEAFIRRADEMLAQVDDADEERNDSYTTTASHINGRQAIKSTLSFSDQADTYKINAPRGTEVVFTLSSDAGGGPTAILSVLDASVDKPEQSPVAITTNALSGAGAQVSCVLPSSDCYVKVSYLLDANGFPRDPYFAFTKAGSTMCPYTLASDSVFMPGEKMEVLSVTDGNPEVWVSLEAGEPYRFVGLDGANAGNAAALDYDEATGLYTAKQGGKAKLTLADDGSGLKFGYQKWNPGTIGFESASKTVRERGNDGSVDWTYTFYVRRTGGVSGVAKAQVVIDEGASSALADGTIYGWSETDQDLVWGEGTNGLKGVDITIKGNKTADGLQKLVFKLVPDDDSAATTNSATAFTLWIEDDDPTNPGVMAIETANGNPVPDSRTIVARGGTVVSVGVERRGGTDGGLAGELFCSGAKAGDVEWAGRTGGEKTVDVTIPAYDDGAANKVQISLGGVSGAKVASAAKYLYVKIVPADAAGFASSAETVPVTRYVETAPLEVGVDAPGAEDVEVELISGSLAPGMSGAFDSDAGKLVVGGTPTKGGTYIATYQVTADGVKGATVQVTVDVADPTVEKDDGTEAENPYVATTRTISDILVLNGAEERLAGLLTLTIPPSGRLSAKFRPVSGTPVSMMCFNWNAYVAKAYKATLEGETEDEKACTLDVAANGDGTVEVALDVGGEPLTCIVPDCNWSSENPAKAWKGYYTASLPFKESMEPTKAFASGDAFVTLRMTTDAAVNSGRMTYAGVLPNGRAFSGSAVVAPRGSAVLLPMLHASSSDVLSGVLGIDPSADLYRAIYPAPGVYPYWTHVETAGESDANYSQKLDAFGCLYNPDVDLVGCCLTTFQTQMLAFFALPENMPDAVPGLALGDMDAWVTNNTAIKVFKSGEPATCRMRPPNPTAAKDAPEALTFSFDRINGLVSGTFNLLRGGVAVPTTFRGVVLPGWGTASCSTCSDGSQEAIKRPFVSGACWFDDRYEYDGGGGQIRKVSVRRGCPISVGLEPGQ